MTDNLPADDTGILADLRVRAAAASHPYPLVFLTVSGAHLYGFASPDSDVDLRGAHLLPIERVVNLDPGPDTVEVSEVRDGLEIDLVTHDLHKFITLLMKRNGYVLEQLLSPIVVAGSPAFDELRELAPGCITRNHAHHYLGFAATQWELFEKEEPRQVKPLLYVYRVLLTGIELMRSGRVECNLPLLAQRARLMDVLDLVALKQSGAEHETLPPTDLAHHERRYRGLISRLETAMAESSLPERPAGRAALDALLLKSRTGGIEARTRVGWYPCPCCGYLTMHDLGGSEYCSICGWEDDLVQLRWVDAGGPNHVSLIEAQRNFEAYGWSEENRVDRVRRPRADDVRDAGWRRIDPYFGDVEPYGKPYPAWPRTTTTLYYWRPTYWRRTPNDSVR
jgi:predicted nucleotidyltransferase